MKNTERYCLDCGKLIEGRIDKKFCNEYCKSSFHYKKNQQNENSSFKTIDKQLKTNRRILKNFNQAGKATVRKQALLASGFNPNYFTHYWKNKNGQVYLFCYEYGYLALKENQKDKYVLIKWQPYMN